MITMHCTYPDGSTSEARFYLPMDYFMAEMEHAAMGGTFGVNRYEIFTEWTSGVEPTGMIVYADSPDRAVEIAVMRGVCAGLGYRRDYIGLVAR